MKTYLSFGGGVNSVALLLLMLEQKWEFEAVFVDHGSDWPETYEYTQILIDKGYEITIVRPQYKDAGVWENLYDYCWSRHMMASRNPRWCTSHFKVEPLRDYFKYPCVNCLGFASDEAHRAKLVSRDGETLRYPLIEEEMTRQDCIDYIKSAGLPVPMKSGCWFCPFQRKGELKKLRIEHPELWCKFLRLENRNLEWRKSQGKEPYYIFGKPLEAVVEETQNEMWDEFKPPCYCNG